MKTKIFLTLLISIVITSSSFSQLGLKGGFALGQKINHNVSNIHFGFDLGLTYDITESLRGEVLFETMFNKESAWFYGDLNSRMMPITVGIDYRFLTGIIQPFVGLNLGVMSLASKFGSGSYTGNSYFEFHPKVGVNVKITDNILIDATIKYHVVFNKNNVNNKNTQVLAGNIGLIYVFN